MTRKEQGHQERGMKRTEDLELAMDLASSTQAFDRQRLDGLCINIATVLCGNRMVCIKPARCRRMHSELLQSLVVSELSQT